ncbi:MAG: LPS export ABC transporter periplasmic protein LptC [Rhodobacteraceae bacterium]|nr:LPS export ABC transporter periplasmic protein LptC [Paracoccaceae bacterium]
MVLDNLHSRLVALLKVLLPLAALAVLATLFLFQQRIDPTRAIPYATVDVEEIAREAAIGGPTYAGVGEDGTAITVAAETARPDPADPRRMTAEAVRAALEMADGSRVDIRAAAGAVDGPGGRMELSGGVEIRTSTGYRVTTERLAAMLDRTHVATDTAVAAEGPPGRIAAGSLEIVAEAGARDRYLLVFGGGVKLLYDPGTAGQDGGKGRDP